MSHIYLCRFLCDIANVSRDRPEVIFINLAETETGPNIVNVVSAENETEAEFNTLFRPIPKPKINCAECITFTYLIQNA